MVFTGSTFRCYPLLATWSSPAQKQESGLCKETSQHFHHIQNTTDMVRNPPMDIPQFSFQRIQLSSALDYFLMSYWPFPDGDNVRVCCYCWQTVHMYDQSSGLEHTHIWTWGPKYSTFKKNIIPFCWILENELCSDVQSSPGKQGAGKNIIWIVSNNWENKVLLLWAKHLV